MDDLTQCTQMESAMSQSIRTNSGATASGSGHCSGDAGVVLPMAMVFVLVIGAVVVVLLDQAQTNFRSIWATRGVQERVYASNAGVNFGMAELQRFAVVNGSIPCGDGTQAGQSLGSIKVNNRLVTVTCSVAGNSQVVLGPQAWAAFITNSSGAIDTNDFEERR